MSFKLHLDISQFAACITRFCELSDIHDVTSVHQ